MSKYYILHYANKPNRIIKEKYHIGRFTRRVEQLPLTERQRSSVARDKVEILRYSELLRRSTICCPAVAAKPKRWISLFPIWNKNLSIVAPMKKYPWHSSTSVLTTTRNNCKTQNFPVIVVKFQDGRELKLSYFIDHLGRVYNTYSEFLKDNTLDDWLIAVPNLRKVMTEETESENEQLRNNPFRGPNWTE